MNRFTLIGQLENYNPTDSKEKEYKNKIIDFAKQHEDCFERSLDIGHITASAWLLNKDKSKALLMHHTKLDMWMQLGGHCDGNPDVLAVAIKEAQEESGVSAIEPVLKSIFDIGVYLIPAIGKEKEHYHYDVCFLLRVTSDESVVQNRESKELRWIGLDKNELPSDLESTTRMFYKWSVLS